MSKVVYKNGIHDISNNEYHASSGISRSMLMDFKRCPHYYWYKHISGLAVKEDSSPAMNLGNAVHTLTLEEHKFDSEFYVIHQQTRPRRSTPAYQKMIDAAEGKIIITNDEYLQAVMMSDSVKQNNYCAQLLEDCLMERSIYFTHESTGLQVKARPDAWCGALICDLKTTADASLWSFQKSAVNYGYFLQAAIIKLALDSIGIEMENFAFIPVEKESPFSVGVYVADKDAINYGIRQFESLIKGIDSCMRSGIWAGYGVKDLSVPKYILNEEFEGIEL